MTTKAGTAPGFFRALKSTYLAGSVGQRGRCFASRQPGRSLQHDTARPGVATPDGRQVATANGKTVRVFDAASGKKLSEWEAHADDVTCLAFTPDGKKLVTGSKDKTAKVWERE